jgi:hypothetical protein
MLRVLEVTVKKTFPLVRLAFLRVVPRAVEARVGILFATTHPYLYTGPHLNDLEPSSALKRLIIRNDDGDYKQQMDQTATNMAK